MQQKANEVVFLVNKEVVSYKDVNIIEIDSGIYVEDTVKIGTDNEGEDLIQRRLTYYREECLLKIVWAENSLVESVIEKVIAEMVQDKIDSLLDLYEDSDDEIIEETSGSRDDPEFDPYKKKED